VTKQRRRPAAFALGLAIVVAVSAVGGVHGATPKSRPVVTTKVMVEGLKAIGYPVAHPRRLTCRGLGAATHGRHTSFRCVATLKSHRRRPFYTRAIAKGGWLCAGKRLSHCVLLGRGFVPASAADNQGWQETAVLGWLQAHEIDRNGALSLSCVGTKSPMTCTLHAKPPVTVTLTYYRAGPGYVETATRG
jgi:hypothetical protein